jgi:phosphoenolpyruvate carboxylase
VRFAENALDRLSRGLPYVKLADTHPGGEPDDFEGDEAWSHGLFGARPIFDVEELRVPLEIIHASLRATGYGQVADGSLIDTLRRISAFGMTLTPLDIREESDKHTEALDAITKHLGIGRCVPERASEGSTK